jgi:hypothetical protein
MTCNYLDLLVDRKSFSAIFLLLFASAQIAKGAPGRPIIRVIDDDKDIIYIDEKGVRQRVCAHSKKDLKLMQQTQVSISRKLGARSLHEVIDKDLWQLFEDEMKKRIIVEEYPNRPRRIQFLNANGGVVKEIDLNSGNNRESIDIVLSRFSFKDSPYGSSSDEKDAISEWRNIGDREIVYDVSKEAFTNNEEDHVCLLVTEAPVAVIKKDGTKISMDEPLSPTSEIAVYDVAGREKWRRRMPEGRAVSFSGENEPIVSHDGGRVVVHTSGGEVSFYQVQVFDKEGKPIFSYPKPDSSGSDGPDVGSPVLSPNGKYLSMEVDNNIHRMYDIFFDLDSGRSWESETRLLVYEISDVGMALTKEAWTKGSKVQMINIAEKLRTK